ncbi:hypothetical protein TRICI_005780 [Trichomonascus ciferrii]|uniref:Uncharacterized protein n=1 Tax=Trichomonascus ciferrii TaxID=44093 RepID=A0A642UPU3_9ASCO|nr:hypothetical protein TRICI_005780 [Trichomonascus ciferrii]
MYMATRPVRRKPRPEKPAVIPSAMMYFGASLGRKMLVEIRPAALASGTPTALSTARLVSLNHPVLASFLYHVLKRTYPGVLLLYQAARMTLPELQAVIAKVIPYTALLPSMSTAAYAANPMMLTAKDAITYTDRIWVKSDANARISKNTAPKMFGATVYRFVMVVERLPMAPTI